MRKKISTMIIVIMVLQIVLPMMTVILESDFTIKSIAVETLEATVDGITWLADLENGKLTNLKPASKISFPAEITIPNEINGTAVTSIAEEAFSSCLGLRSVVIPSNIIKIGDRAFYDCDITSVKIGENVETIGTNAFYSCDYLSQITIPDSVKTIGHSAFNGCTALKTVSIGAGVTSIEDYAFDDCASLENLTIPGNVKTIGKYAFNNCANLKSLLIKDGVETINHRAFNACSSLKNIVLPNSVKTIGNYVFVDCSGLTSIVIPKTTTSIGESVFDNCEDLKILCLKDSTAEEYAKTAGNVSVVYIGDYIFDLSLNSDASIIGVIDSEGTLTIRGTGKMKNGEIAVEGSGITSSQIKQVIIEDGVTNIGENAFQNCSSLTSVTIGKDVKEIGQLAFLNCSSLTSIRIPSGVTSIGDNAFYSCTGLTSIVVDTGNQYYSSSNGVLFNKDKTTLIVYPTNKNVSEYKVPDTVTSIKFFAFYQCKVLTKIIINKQVVNMSSNAFYMCKQVTIYCEKGSTAETYAKNSNMEYVVGDYIFDLSLNSDASIIGVIDSEGTFTIRGTGKMKNGEIAVEGSGITSSQIKQVIIEDGVTNIGENAFQNCSSLTSVTIGKDVTEIGQLAFLNCSSLTSIKIPRGVTSIGDNAFYSCTGLTSIEVDTGNQYYSSEDGVLFNKDKTTLIVYPTNKNVSEYKVPDTVTSIKFFAFYQCKVLTKIIINKQVVNMSSNAFYMCKQVTIYCEKGSTAETHAKNTNMKYVVKELSGIEIIQAPNKTHYVEGQNFDKTGMTVKAIDTFGESKTVTDYTVIDGSNLTIDKTSVTISYTEDGVTRTATQGITVIAKALSKIEIRTSPTKKEYIEGETLDTTGLIITAMYNDGTTEEITKGFTCTPTKLNTVGTQIITVTYGGKTDTFTVTVTAKELTGITVKTAPSKTEYIEGETLDTTGLILTATYNNGTTADITEGFDYSPKTLNTVGTQTITVTYGGQKATFDVTVTAKRLTGITVKTAPSKTEYIEGETLNAVGLVITATYNNGTTEEITQGFICTPSQLNIVGTQTITVTYGGKIASFSVKVVKKADVNGDNKIDFMDMLQINRHRLGKIKLEGINLRAADVNGDNKVDFMDMLKVNQYRLGKSL